MVGEERGEAASEALAVGEVGGVVGAGHAVLDAACGLVVRGVGCVGWVVEVGAVGEAAGCGVDCC